MIRTVNVIRYITPLREGGSLPAIIEADDKRLYVMKFRGAGQGVKALNCGVDRRGARPKIGAQSSDHCFYGAR